MGPLYLSCQWLNLKKYFNILHGEFYDSIYMQFICVKMQELGRRVVGLLFRQSTLNCVIVEQMSAPYHFSSGFCYLYVIYIYNKITLFAHAFSLFKLWLCFILFKKEIKIKLINLIWPLRINFVCKLILYLWTSFLPYSNVMYCNALNITCLTNWKFLLLDYDPDYYGKDT